MKRLVISLILTLQYGCASIASLPQSAADVDFASTTEGKTGWSEYQGAFSTPRIDENIAYEAAKAGLRGAGFTVSRGIPDRQAIMGEHGMTAYDWNVVAGVYYQSDETNTYFKTIVEGSKDIGFSGDATGSDWVGRILSGVRSYIATVSPAVASGPQQAASSGTCFVVSPEGMILSNEHVVSGAAQVTVILSDGRELEARTVAQSRSNDLALMQVDASDLAYLSLSAPRSARLGMEVFTVGYPLTSLLGQQIKFTDGTISSLSGISDEASFMQITVPLQPGNSGGPLVNDAGEVVGITTATAAVENFYSAAGTLPQNINWAVKSDYALLMFDQPEALPPTSDRADAIERATAAACRVVVAR